MSQTGIDISRTWETFLFFIRRLFCCYGSSSCKSNCTCCSDASRRRLSVETPVL